MGKRKKTSRKYTTGYKKIKGEHMEGQGTCLGQEVSGDTYL